MTVDQPTPPHVDIAALIARIDRPIVLVGLMGVGKSSVGRRLATMLDRSERAGDLLRTRVDVQRSAQNQELMVRMDRRADLQLRLQHTVEGLSVVAIASILKRSNKARGRIASCSSCSAMRS